MVLKKQLYRIDEVADMFCVHPRTVRNWLDAGKFDYLRLDSHKGIRIPADSIRTFYDANLVKADE